MEYAVNCLAAGYVWGILNMLLSLWQQAIYGVVLDMLLSDWQQAMYGEPWI